MRISGNEPSSVDHTLSKLYDYILTPPPILRLNIAYFAVAKGWLLLDIG